MFALVSSCAVSLFPLFVLGKAHGSVAKAFLLMVIIKNHFHGGKISFSYYEKEPTEDLQCKIFAPQPNKSRAKPTILPTFKSERYGDLDICSGKERAQLPNCLGGGSPPPASYFSPLSLSPQFRFFAT